MKRLPFRFATSDGQLIDTHHPSEPRYDIFQQSTDNKLWYHDSTHWSKKQAKNELLRLKTNYQYDRFVLLELKQIYTQIS